MVSKRLYDRGPFIYSLFAVSFLITLVISYSIYQSLAESRENNRQVIASLGVMEKSNELLSTLKDAETGQRGFLITGADQYLQPYRSARRTLPRTYAELAQLTRINPAQQRHLQFISGLMRDKMDEMERTIFLKEYQGMSAAERVVQQDIGIRKMDSLRLLIASIQSEEKMQLRDWERRYDQSARRVNLVQVAGSLSNVVLYALVFALLWRKFRREKQTSQELEKQVQFRTEELHAANEELHAANEEQHALIEELTQSQDAMQAQQKEIENAYAQLSEDNTRKTTELTEAQTIQLAMLPATLPQLAHLDVGMFMQPATEVGGDYYDYVFDEKGQLTFAIGDATGHGFKSGIMVATVKSYFQTLAAQSACTGPDILRQISNGIRNMAMRGMYMGLAVVKFRENQVAITAAGVPPALLYRAASQTVEPIRQEGMFLGFNSNQVFRERTLSVATGDVLLVMTDGLMEQFNSRKQQMPIDRISALFQSVATRPSDQIIAALNHLREEWAESTPQQDDVSLVVIRFR